jgi:trehalose utilization protein
VWNEFAHEQTDEVVKQLYPKGMHAVIAEVLNGAGGITATGSTLYDPEQGLPDEKLNNTEVLLWWGHARHDEVLDANVDRIQKRVLAGMGLIVLHSGHCSKIFRRMMGTSCLLRWREAAEKERIWVTNPSHPIVQDLPPYFELPHEEMYGEHFDVPHPDETLMISWFEGGEVFRSGCTWTRGLGKIFYFRPGHEAYPTYFDANVRKVLVNAVRWAKPTSNREVAKFYGFHAKDSIEPIRSEHTPGLGSHPKG